jgi:hypothetical protein
MPHPGQPRRQGSQLLFFSKPPVFQLNILFFRIFRRLFIQQMAGFGYKPSMRAHQGTLAKEILPAGPGIDTAP